MLLEAYFVTYPPLTQNSGCWLVICFSKYGPIFKKAQLLTLPLIYYRGINPYQKEPTRSIHISLLKEMIVDFRGFLALSLRLSWGRNLNMKKKISSVLNSPVFQKPESSQSGGGGEGSGRGLAEYIACILIWRFWKDTPFKENSPEIFYTLRCSHRIYLHVHFMITTLTEVVILTFNPIFLITNLIFLLGQIVL